MTEPPSPPSPEDPAEQFQQLLDSAREYAIFMTDTDRRITTWNAGAERVLGWTEEEALGMSADVVFTPEDRAAGPPKAEMEEAVRAGHAEGDRWHVRKGGARFRATGVMTVLRDGGGALRGGPPPPPRGGTLRGFAKVFRDNTRQWEGDEALRDGPAHAFADAAPAMTWVTDPSGACTFLSRAWYEHTGQTEGEGLGLGWLDAVHPDDRGAARAVFLAASERGEPFRVDYRLRRHDGTYRWAFDAGRPRLSDGGESLGFVGSVVDIDGRKRAEEALSRSVADTAFRATLADALRPVSDPVAVQGVAARVLGEHLGANRSFYVEFDDDGEHFVVHRDYAVGVASFVGRYVADSFGPSVIASLRAGEPFVAPDVADAEGWTADEKSAYAAADVGAYVAAPLVKRGRLAAVLGIHQREPRAWTAAEVALVEETAERT